MNLYVPSLSVQADSTHNRVVRREEGEKLAKVGFYSHTHTCAHPQIDTFNLKTAATLFLIPLRSDTLSSVSRFVHLRNIVIVFCFFLTNDRRRTNFILQAVPLR